MVEDTKGYVEKKQASTYEELVAEQELKAEEVKGHTNLCMKDCNTAECQHESDAR